MPDTVVPSPPSDFRAPHPPGVPPVEKREIVAWAFFDFANSGYTTVVITAVFSAYFAKVVAGNAPWSTLAWTVALSVSYALNVLTSPLIGAYADLKARKKPLLVIATIACVLFTGLLALCGAGEVALALAIIVVGNFAFGMGENLIAAFLPELVKQEAMGKVSGWGWGLGYTGGLLALALCLAWILLSGRPDSVAVPESMLITAVIFALAALPSLFWLRERAVPQAASNRQVWALARQRVREAISGSSGLRDLRRFLACIVCYQAGVQTVIALAAIYTTQALGFTFEQTIVLIMVVNVTAALGAFAFSFVQDRIGHKKTIAITLAMWIVTIAAFTFSRSVDMVWVAANLAGVCMGASQSAGRALVGYLCPPSREAEIFGLWGLAVKLASILGPLSYGVVNAATDGNHRLSIAVTAVFFVAGLVVLARVDVQRGHAAARAA